jgi:sialidase-1
MKVIMDMGGWGGKPEIQNGIGDPAILVDRQTNTIWVAGIWAHGHPGKRNWNASKPGLLPAETSQLMLTKSEDDGLTWTEPINITSMVKKPEWHLLLQGPGKGITMIDGTLVFAAQYKDKNQIPHSTILYSKDQGKTWQLGTGAKSKTTESQVVELKDGSLMLNMRDDRGRDPVGNGYRSVAITSDLGKTWIEHPSSRKSLIEPVCNASLIKHVYTINGDVNEILLFVNPADQYKRKNMTIKVSFDEGRTWPASYHTLIDAGTGRGYPSLTSIDQNTIGILYEGSQADLVFQKFSLTQLLSKD